MTDGTLRLSPAVAFPERPRRFSQPVEDFLRRGLAALPDLGRGWTFLRLRRITAAARGAEPWARAMIAAGAADAARAAGLALRRSPSSRRAAGRLLALCRAASEATLGMRPYDVQIRGAAGLLEGRLVEMETGEGKTLTAALAATAAALAGTFAHVVTVNDYLAARDAERLRPFYEKLGLVLGLITHAVEPAARRAAYASDVLYITNKELAFDYLRDGLCRQRWPNDPCRRLARLSGAPGSDTTVMRGLRFAIVDEADSVLIDEARTPLIISGAGEGGADGVAARAALECARSLVERQDFMLDRLTRTVTLTEYGWNAVTQGPWPAREAVADTLRIELVQKALSALHLFERDIHYLVADGQVQIIDEYTDRLMEDRFWNDGLHQMVEMKEGLDPSDMRRSLARITYQRFFTRYHRLSGMSGTLRECRRELREVYGLKVTRIPTHRRSRRRFGPPQVFATASAKWQGVAARAADLAGAGRAVLIGTRTVAASRLAAAALTRAGVDHVVLNAAQDADEAEIIAQAGRVGRVTVATNMAGRGTDISLEPEVAARGGLAVIATERHEAARIDRQLAGRCGRQGDPGSVHVMVSCEDSLLDLFRGQPPGQALLALARFNRRLALFLIRRAQRRAEKLHHGVRRELLRFEDRLQRALAFAGPPE